ncbi:MAG: hypothetical protein ABL986_18975 [Vicinamibacterales bacterium]
MLQLNGTTHAAQSIGSIGIRPVFVREPLFEDRFLRRQGSIVILRAPAAVRFCTAGGPEREPG